MSELFEQVTIQQNRVEKYDDPVFPLCATRSRGAPQCVPEEHTSAAGYSSSLFINSEVAGNISVKKRNRCISVVIECVCTLLLSFVI